MCVGQKTPEKQIFVAEKPAEEEKQNNAGD